MEDELGRVTIDVCVNATGILSPGHIGEATNVQDVSEV